MGTLKGYAMVALSLASVVVLTACSDIFYSSYTSLTEAREKGAVERGWIPSYLNPKASAIQEVHNLDTNEVCGIFQFPKGESPVEAGKLRSISVEEVMKRPFRTADPKWWPHLLRPPLDPASLKKAELRLLRDPDGGFPFAVDQQKGLAISGCPIKGLNSAKGENGAV
jgi:hypothetical protein